VAVKISTRTLDDPIVESRPEWEPPWPLGYRNSINSAGTIAAPLLAAASFTFIGLIVPKADQIRYPSVTLCFLIAAALLFVAAIQLSFWSLQYAITPADVESWHPTVPEDEKRDILRVHSQAYSMWAKGFSTAYRAGILALLVGVTLSLVPDGRIDTGRWIGIAIGGAGFVGEAWWITASWILQGSYDALYYVDQVDTAPSTANWLQRRPLLRWMARAVTPLVHLHLPRPARAAPPPTS
jgi:MFS family permease